MSILSEIVCENLIKVYEIYETEETYLIIMEYFEGGELFNI